MNFDIFNVPFLTTQGGFSLLMVLIVNAFGAGLFGYFWLLKNRISTRSIFEMIFTVGISALIIVCYLIVLISRYWPDVFLYARISLLLFSTCSISILAFKIFPFLKWKISYSVIAFAFLLCCIAILRFYFIDGLEFPLYSDSPVHYQIIKDILNPIQPSGAFYNFEKLFSPHYYHFGFHSVVAVDAGISGTNILPAILIVGQLFLIIAPISLALFVKRLTFNTWAGLYTGLFAGLGWDMPAYAVNWGKYPAVAAIAVIPLTFLWLTFALLTKEKRKQRLFWLLFLLTFIATAILHTRSIIITAVVLGTIVIVRFMRKAFNNQNEKVYEAIILETLAIVVLATVNQNFYDAILSYFQDANLVVSCLAILLMAFGAIYYGEVIYAILTFTLVCWVISFLTVPPPLTKYLGEYFLDRPFIQTFMFAPLAISSGIGLQSLFRYVVSKTQKKTFTSHGNAHLAVFIAVALFLVFLRPASDYRPNPCCIFMQEDDLFAIDWIGKNIPHGSQILIASEKETNQNIVVDGGGWIYPLTGIATVPASYSTDFASSVNHVWLCTSHISYVYVGSTSAGFDATNIESKSSYKLLLGFPQARLYQVNCETP